MTYGLIRFIKWSLFVALVSSGAYVSFFLWKGVRERGVGNSITVDEPKSPTSRQVELEQLDSEGRTTWTLTAAESVGQSEAGQRFLDVEIHFMAKDDTPVIVTADECAISSKRAVHLEGNVVVVDDTSLRLEAETLEFRRYPDRVWSMDPVRYSKKGFHGTAGSMAFTINRGELDLEKNVEMTFSEDAESPIHVTSRVARLRRGRHWVQYIDDVRVRQTSRRLSANDLQLFMDEQDEHVTRVEAFELVELHMEVSSDAPNDEAASDGDAGSALASEAGTKQLVTDRLEMEFREGGEELSLVRALEGGKLTMRLPDDAATGLDKTLEGNLLAFAFNEQSELTQVRGRGGVELVLSPRDASQPQKVVRSRRMESDFDPTSGDLVQARCSRSVTFEQGDVRASAEEGVFTDRESLLVLTESPRLWDPRVSLNADRIELDVETGDVTGDGRVRSASGGGAGAEAGSSVSLFPSSDDSPVHFVSDRMTYDRKEDIATYSGAARAFQGESRVEAETIELHQTTGDLMAEGSVRSVFQQRMGAADEAADEAADAASTPTMTRSNTLHYRSAEERFEYRGEASMRSEKMTLSGDSIEVTIGNETEDVAAIVATGEVEIETEDGEAAGDHAKYLPSDDSMTITGEDAWLSNAGKVTEGKQLTFFLTDDRILVDGQEQNRTKTTYTSKPRF